VSKYIFGRSSYFRTNANSIAALDYRRKLVKLSSTQVSPRNAQIFYKHRRL